MYFYMLSIEKNNKKLYTNDEWTRDSADLAVCNMHNSHNCMQKRIKPGSWLLAGLQRKPAFRIRLGDDV